MTSIRTTDPSCDQGGHQASRPARGVRPTAHTMEPSPSPQRRPCKGRKIKHPTVDRALAHVRGLERWNERKGRAARPGCRLHAYWCQTCSAYHVGHGPDDQPQTIEEQSL